MLSFNWNNTGVTVELGELVDSGVDIWAFEYPVPKKTVTYNGKTAPVPFDKVAFEQKIIDHYRFRQIGQETVGRWLHYFRARIKEIMPYYCQLYEFEAKWQNVDDPLESYNLREEYSEERTGTGTVTGTSEGNNTSTSTGSAKVTDEARDTVNGTDTKTATVGNVKKFSNTPQGTIANLDDHLTEATVDDGSTSENLSRKDTTEHTSEQTSTSSGTVTDTGHNTSEQTSEDAGTVTSTMTRRGNIGVQPLGTEVKNIREAFINIDLMVINELKDLFLQVY